MPNATTPLANLHAIVAVCDDWGIGAGGGMVVENRADMRHFVTCTQGHTVLMGRKTLESFPGGKPLKRRRNIVVTRDMSFQREGVEVAHALDEALALLGPDEECWVIGGGQVYQALLPLCATAEVTKNHCVRAADTYFPNLDDSAVWQLAATVSANEKGDPLQTAEGIAFEFCTYVNAGTTRA